MEEPVKYKRELTKAELEGWRQFWDPHMICPECALNYIIDRNRRVSLTSWLNAWEVPIDYAAPVFAVREERKCARCNISPHERRMDLLRKGKEPVFDWAAATMGLQIAYFAYKQKAQLMGISPHYFIPRKHSLDKPIPFERIVPDKEPSRSSTKVVYVRKDVLPVSVWQVAILAVVVLGLMAYFLWSMGAPT